MTLEFICNALRDGLPAELLPGAVMIGEGSQRRAYLVGDWVVKPNTVPYFMEETYREPACFIGPDDPCTTTQDLAPRAALALLSLDVIECHYVGTWVVQPWVRPLTRDEKLALCDVWEVDLAPSWSPDTNCVQARSDRSPWRKVYLEYQVDIHFANVGVDVRTNTVVAFDW